MTRRQVGAQTQSVISGFQSHPGHGLNDVVGGPQHIAEPLLNGALYDLVFPEYHADRGANLALHFQVTGPKGENFVARLKWAPILDHGPDPELELVGRAVCKTEAVIDVGGC